MPLRITLGEFARRVFSGREHLNQLPAAVHEGFGFPGAGYR
jgi:hypothetical protein